MSNRFSADWFACGLDGLPNHVEWEGRTYRCARLFKHDFFAATGLYEADAEVPPAADGPARIILKVNRLQPFFGIPMAWLGKRLRDHEVEILQALQDLPQIPRLLGRYGPCGFLYEYIEGRSLDEGPDIPDSFFDECRELFRAIHDRGICYLDTNKRGNILVGSDRRPYLIDFQISQRFNGRWKRLQHALQREDMYHLYKHKRRFRPDLLTPEEETLSRRRSSLIRIHRFIATPLRRLRRRLLGWLIRRGTLPLPEDRDYSPENDLQRYCPSDKS